MGNSFVSFVRAVGRVLLCWVLPILILAATCGVIYEELEFFKSANRAVGKVVALERSGQWTHPIVEYRADDRVHRFRGSGKKASLFSGREEGDTVEVLYNSNADARINNVFSSIVGTVFAGVLLSLMPLVIGLSIAGPQARTKKLEPENTIIVQARITKIEELAGDEPGDKKWLVTLEAQDPNTQEIIEFPDEIVYTPIPQSCKGKRVNVLMDQDAMWLSELEESLSELWRENAITVQAKITEVSRETFKDEDQTVFWLVCAEWKDPTTGVVLEFSSDILETEPNSVATGDTINVLVSKDDPETYEMDSVS